MMTLWLGRDAITSRAQEITAGRGHNSRFSTSQSWDPAAKVLQVLSILPPSKVPSTQENRDRGKYWLKVPVRRRLSCADWLGHAEPPGQTAAVSWLPIAGIHGIPAASSLPMADRATAYCE